MADIPWGCSAADGAIRGTRHQTAMRLAVCSNAATPLIVVVTLPIPFGA
jgi:hypothetical protein